MCGLTFEEIKARKPTRQVEFLLPGPVGKNCYALRLDGDCQNPEYKHGDVVLLDPDQMPEKGDFVAIWWKSGRDRPIMKRLVTDLPARELLGLGGDIEPVLILEQLNPPKFFTAIWENIEAIHKVTHPAPGGNLP